VQVVASQSRGVVPGTAYTISSNVPEGKVLEAKPGSETPITIRVHRKEKTRSSA
jgi:hypothetical protein